MRICPYCNSKAIYRFRRDSDWGGGCEFEPVNEDRFYSEEHLRQNESAPDLELFYCAECMSVFDPDMEYPAGAWIDASRIKERVENVRETLCFKTKNYNHACDIAKAKLSQFSNAEMATKVQPCIEDLQRQHSELDKLNELITNLEHILQSDAHSYITKKPIPIKKRTIIRPFRGTYDFLSNFYPCEITYEGLTYQSVEAAFQAQKTLSRSAKIEFTQLEPAQAKKKGKSVELRKDWENIKVQVMETLVWIKFSQNPQLREKLLATGDAILQEGNNWGDRFWGTDDDGNGENHLGQILMEIRKRITMGQVVYEVTPYNSFPYLMFSGCTFETKNKTYRFMGVERLDKNPRSPLYCVLHDETSPATPTYVPNEWFEKRYIDWHFMPVDRYPVKNEKRGQVS